MHDVRRSLPPAAFLALMLTAPALAHEIENPGQGFASGFWHPITGLDHVVAMVAVGLWGAQLRKPAIWLLPVVFPIVMAIGGALGIRGVPLPGVEIGIAASALAIGALIAFAVKLPLWFACAIVGAFAIFHGHAHGTELPHAASPIGYSIGFVIATGLLHLSGIALGLLHHLKGGPKIVRACGGAIACAGAFFLVMIFVGD